MQEVATGRFFLLVFFNYTQNFSLEFLACFSVLLFYFIIFGWVTSDESDESVQIFDEFQFQLPPIYLWNHVNTFFYLNLVQKVSCRKILLLAHTKMIFFVGKEAEQQKWV